MKASVEIDSRDAASHLLISTGERELVDVQREAVARRVGLEGHITNTVDDRLDHAVAAAVLARHDDAPPYQVGLAAVVARDPRRVVVPGRGRRRPGGARHVVVREGFRRGPRRLLEDRVWRPRLAVLSFFARVAAGRAPGALAGVISEVPAALVSSRFAR